MAGLFVIFDGIIIRMKKHVTANQGTQKFIKQ
jgi:hypothetical protein